MISIVLVDDEELVRGGIRMIVGAQPDMEVVGEAAGGRDGVEVTRERDPDLVLMDLRMPDGDGIEATRAIVAAGLRARVLVLTTFDLDEHVHAALRAGASGYLLKSMAPEALVDAIRRAAAGEPALAPAVVTRLIAQVVDTPADAHGEDERIARLTAREREVLRLVAAGSSNAEVCAALHVSEPTVRTHLTHILAKLEVRDRIHAIVLAHELGFTDG